MYRVTMVGLDGLTGSIEVVGPTGEVLGRVTAETDAEALCELQNRLGGVAIRPHAELATVDNTPALKGELLYLGDINTPLITCDRTSHRIGVDREWKALGPESRGALMIFATWPNVYIPGYKLAGMLNSSETGMRQLISRLRQQIRDNDHQVIQNRQDFGYRGIRSSNLIIPIK
jgi:hypothetical protein